MKKLLNWRKINLLCLFILPLVGIVLWLNSKSSFVIFYYTPWLFIAQVWGILAITFLSLNFLFTTRLRVLRRMFGGLQHVYKIHKYVGICGIVFAVLHLTFFLIHSISYPTLFSVYLIALDYWPINFARIAWTLFLVLTVMTFIKRIPYHIWKLSHQFMGLALFFAVLHVLTIESDVKKNMLLRYWIIVLMSVGLISFLYTRFLYRYLGPKHPFVITRIDNLKGNVHKIHMKPVGKPFRYDPAQFIFVSFLSKKIGSEVHPFTIISTEDEDGLQISPKESGDFTNRLKHLHVGTYVNTWGPYGSFGEKFLIDEKDQVWIAGGIGITPFIGMIAYENFHPMKARKWLFHCARSSDDASYDEYLDSETERLNISVIHHFSDQEGYLTVENITSEVPEMENKLFLVCGPPLMRESVVKQLVIAGIKKSNIVFEDFSLR